MTELDLSKPCPACAEGRHDTCDDTICGCLRDHVGDSAILRGFKRVKRHLHPEREAWVAGGWQTTDRWTSLWKAVLAPLGKTSPDGWRLMADGRWSLREGGAPIQLGVDGPTVGSVNVVYLFNSQLRGIGVIDPAVDLGLKPQVELADVETRTNDDGSVDFVAGVVARVVLSDTPAFPDVWIATATAPEPS